jgi:hypothetical protein
MLAVAHAERSATMDIPDRAARAEATARRVLADATIPDSLRQRARDLLAQAQASRIMHAAYAPRPPRTGAAPTPRQDNDNAAPAG